MKPHSCPALLVAMLVVAGCAVEVHEVSGRISNDTTWPAGRVVVTGDLLVERDATLRIETGTVVTIREKSSIGVAGRIVAEGTAQRPIRFAPDPDDRRRWGGFSFESTRADNRLVHVTIVGISSRGPAIRVLNSRLLLEHVVWEDVGATVLELERPDLVVRHCSFPEQRRGEAIHGRTLLDGDRLEIEHNTFQATQAHDIIDYADARRPGPVVRVLNNTFLGGHDDGIDLDDADGYIEGNHFENFSAGRGASATSNAISVDGGDVVVVRNVFVNNDHALLVKRGGFLELAHNTIVGSRIAAIQLNEGEREIEPGRGARVVGTIFRDNATTFHRHEGRTVLEVHHSILPTQHLALGQGNLDVDPRFIDPRAGDFRLAPDSAAIGAGPAGSDIGALAP